MYGVVREAAVGGCRQGQRERRGRGLLGSWTDSSLEVMGGVKVSKVEEGIPEKQNQQDI